MKQHVMFDLDGTLTDSAPGITRCLAYAVRAMGGTPPALHSLRPFIGTPLSEVFQALLPEADAAKIDDAVAAYIDRFDRVGIRENSVFPGILEALEALRQEGCDLYVATLKGQDVAERVVHQFGLDSFFRGVFGAQFERGIATKEEILLFGLQAEGIPSSDATMVGDRNHDIEAARALGIYAIGVSWGYGSIEELSFAQAIADAPDTLVSLIRK